MYGCMQAYNMQEKKSICSDYLSDTGGSPCGVITVLSSYLSFYMYTSQYDANQGNIQSHYLPSRRWMREQDSRSGNNTSCISHSILSRMLTAVCRGNHAAAPLILPACVIYQTHQCGPGQYQHKYYNIFSDTDKCQDQSQYMLNSTRTTLFCFASTAQRSKPQGLFRFELFLIKFIGFLGLTKKCQEFGWVPWLHS